MKTTAQVTHSMKRKWKVSLLGAKTRESTEILILTRGVSRVVVADPIICEFQQPDYAINSRYGGMKFERQKVYHRIRSRIDLQNAWLNIRW